MEPGAKVVVTEIALDDWIMQMYGYSFDNFPRNAPANMPRELHEELKKKYYKFIREREQKQISPRSKAMLYPNMNFKQPAAPANPRPKSSASS